MDFTARVREFAKECEERLPHLRNEEGTKVALVLPFLRLLGYDTTNPAEIVAEFTADIGTKKGERVDFAIKINGRPMVLLEVKSYGDELTAHDTQLFRYLTATDAKFAILTDGIRYKFFTDLEVPNRMDSQPFFEVDLIEADDRQLAELGRLEKTQFDVDEFRSAASELKYSKKIKEVLAQELKTPTDDFVRFWLRHVWSGKLTNRVVDSYRDVVRKALVNYIHEQINERLRYAMENVGGRQGPAAEAGDEVRAATAMEDYAHDNEEAESLSEEEKEAIYIIKALIRREVDPMRIAHAKGSGRVYIRVDNNQRNWICRLQFGRRAKRVELRDRPAERLKLEDLNSLYPLEDRFREIGKGVVGSATRQP
jgi:predicted type IV restriction endonuclease